jgi:hypothetical protein
MSVGTKLPLPEGEINVICTPARAKNMKMIIPTNSPKKAITSPLNGKLGFVKAVGFALAMRPLPIWVGTTFGTICPAFPNRGMILLIQ